MARSGKGKFEGAAGFLRKLYVEDGRSLREVGEMIGVSVSTAHRMLKALGIPRRRGGPHGPIGNKLTRVKVTRIRAALRRGESPTRLAVAYDVSRQTIHSIKTGETWVGVGEE